MSEFTRWQQLNEALGFPLGVKNSQSLGLSGVSFDERKKKMDYDDEQGEVPGEQDTGPDEYEDEDEEEKEVDVLDKDDDDDDEDGEKKPCDCDKPELDAKAFCKKCKKYSKKNAKKNAKKNLKKESAFSPYNEFQFEQMPEVGTEEYREKFFASLKDHFGDPNQKHDDGINLEEEIIFEPTDDQLPKSENPQPGQPGFAPQSRIGGFGGQDTPPRADWEQQWQQIGEQFVEFLASKSEK